MTEMIRSALHLPGSPTTTNLCHQHPFINTSCHHLHQFIVLYILHQQLPSIAATTTISGNKPINPYQQNHQQGNTRRNGKRAPRHLTLLPEPLSQVFQKLLKANLINLVLPKPMMGPLPKNQYQYARCAHHMDTLGDDTEDHRP